MVLGRTPAGVDVRLDPAAGHSLFVGETRSGKSVQVYGVLAQLPRDGSVTVAGIDPTGVLLNALGPALGGPGLRVLTLADPERVRAVVTALLEEMDRRIGALLAAGQDKVTEFSREYPLVVVILEEFPGTLAALKALDAASGARVVDRLETLVRLAVQRIALEGLKVGFTIALLSQRADVSLLTGVLRANLTNRCAFRSDPEGLRMIFPAITPEQVEKSQAFRPGRAFAQLVGDATPFEYQADMITYSELAKEFRS